MIQLVDTLCKYIDLLAGFTKGVGIRVLWYWGIMVFEAAFVGCSCLTIVDPYYMSGKLVAPK
jgi:hypothetical protein